MPRIVIMNLVGVVKMFSNFRGRIEFLNENIN